MRNKLNDEEKKVTISITINPKLNFVMYDKKNKSKYIERLIYMDLIKNKKIDKSIIL